MQCSFRGLYTYDTYLSNPFLPQLYQKASYQASLRPLSIGGIGEL